MLGKNIQYLRKQKHMTQEDLALKLNVSRQAISKWEAGSSEPDINTLVKLSEIFNVSIDELIKGIYEEKPSPITVNTNRKSRIILVIILCLIVAPVVYHVIDNMLNTTNQGIQETGDTLEEIQQGATEDNSLLLNEIKEYDNMKSIGFNIDITSYQKQQMLFSGTIETTKWYTSGTLTVCYLDGSEEVLELDCGKLEQTFKKEIPAKSIDKLVIDYNNDEVVLEDVKFRIEEYMYGFDYYNSYIINYDDDFEIKQSYSLNDAHYKEKNDYFDMCMNVNLKDSDEYDDEMSSIFPMAYKIYKNDYVIKEGIIESIDELNKNITINEEYNPQASYMFTITYKTPLGCEIEEKVMLEEE